MTNEKKKPIHKARIGLVTASVWKNDTDNGHRFSIKLQRSYRLVEEKRKNKKDDGWRETEYLDRDDLLIAAKVLDRAHNFIADYKQESE